MKKKGFRKGWTWVLLFAMLLSTSGMSSVASAAAKAPKLSTKKVTVTVGASKKVKLKNKPTGAKVTWKSNNKKIAKVNKNGKITGIKEGSTKVTCKVVYKKAKKKVTKNFKINVKVTAVQETTTEAPQVSAAPAATGTNATATPEVTAVPSFTADPAITPAADVKAELAISNIGEERKSANGIVTKDNGVMRKGLSSKDLMSAMGLGWNLGNQLETRNAKATTVNACERSAGNPLAKQKTFDGLKAYGINTVRIPVAWSNLMKEDGTYTISEELLNRVEEVMNYALNNEMYVIINIHWDGGWWGMFGAEDYDAAEHPVRDEAWKKYEAFWTQIANRYKEYSDRLIFEGANEELGARLNDDWQHPEKGESDPTGKLTQKEYYAMAKQINQKFVDIVRSTGGNNIYRHLLIPGFGTVLNETCSKSFEMPVDTAGNTINKMSVSVHYYEPTDFGIARTATNSWGFRDSWGTEEDYTYMTNQMNKLKKFSDAGYGVILGECGCAVTTKDGIPAYLKELFKLCKENSYCPVMWDEGTYYDRKVGYFKFTDVGEVFAEHAGVTPTIPEGKPLYKTGIPVLDVAQNQNPKVVYTWEGEFMRHLGNEDAEVILGQRPGLFELSNPGVGVTNSILDAAGNPTDELTVDFNIEFWHMHLLTDWSKFEKPCIRIYPADNTMSQTAQLQLAYAETPDSQWMYEGAYDQVDASGKTNEKTAWVGKYINLDTDALGAYPWVWLTTNTYTGCSFVKIEICDAAYNADGSKFE